MAKQENDLEVANTTEKELWVLYRILWSFSVTHWILDRAAKTGSHKFLRIIPDSSASQSYPTVRRKCFTIRTASWIHWDRCGSKFTYRISTMICQTNLFKWPARTEIDKKDFQYPTNAICISQSQIQCSPRRKGCRGRVYWRVSNAHGPGFL